MIDPELGSPLSMAVGEALNSLGEAYLTAVTEGFESAQGVSQIHDAALPRLTAVLAELRAGDVNAHGGFWVMADNSRAPMTGQECEAMLSAAIQRRLEIDQIFFSAREEISVAETIDEINAVAFDFGGA